MTVTARSLVNRDQLVMPRPSPYAASVRPWIESGNAVRECEPGAVSVRRPRRDSSGSSWRAALSFGQCKVVVHEWIDGQQCADEGDGDLGTRELGHLRAELDDIDDRLLEDVRARIEVCTRIAHLKERPAIPVMQPRRVGAVHEHAHRYALDHGLSPTVPARPL